MSESIVQIFFNPRRGWCARRRLLALESAFRARGVELVTTESASAPVHIDPQADHIVVFGGDGTLRHVIDAMHRTVQPVPVSVYPAGTINLVARECCYSRAPDRFVARVLSGEPAVDHYTAIVGGKPMLTCASVGPDSFAVQRLSPKLKQRLGRVAYVIAFVGVLVRWPRVNMTVNCDNGRFTCEAIYVAKGRFYAGPWSFAPKARLTEPLLHIVAFERASRKRLLWFAWVLWRRGTIVETEGVHTLTCRELTISSASDAPLQADGDIVAWLPATISLRAEPTRFA